MPHPTLGQFVHNTCDLPKRDRYIIAFSLGCWGKQHGELHFPLKFLSETSLLRAVQPKGACSRSLSRSMRARAKLKRFLSRSCPLLDIRLPNSLPIVDEPPTFFLSYHRSELCHLNHTCSGHLTSSD